MKHFRLFAQTAAFLVLLCGALAGTLQAQETFDVKAHYTKFEYPIPMRDGVKLFTSVYVPKDTSQKYPFMLSRTPYSVAPYGPNEYKDAIGPSTEMAKEGFIFVYQDVRGRYMSEGNFIFMTPHNPNKKGTEVDESSDTYDTIEWLLKNIQNNNGRVGMWGISFPGFYTAAGIMQAHPALKAASPQAPMADTFIGDDFHHNGAFYLPDAFNFFSYFDAPRNGPTKDYGPRFDHKTPDGYRFFRDLGPLANANKNYFHEKLATWNELMTHGTYDDYWKARNVPQHLKNITPAVMTVGGWFDAEDLYGPLKIYAAIEKNNPKAFNMLVMGPWVHGGWARTDGDALGNVKFGAKQSFWYRKEVELPFFNYFLKDKGTLSLPEAVIFETGRNQWHKYESWPPKNAQAKSLYLHPKGKLSFEPPTEANPKAFDEYVSDPAKPVPVTAETRVTTGRTFIVEDQRFAANRPDVLVYESDVLKEDMTLAGPIVPKLFASTSGSDCDFIVKVIDVYPNDTPDPDPNPTGVRMGGFAQLVRAEVLRAKFRNSYEKPEPMTPNQPTKIEYELRDVHHTFMKGHKIMVQVQSTWFPMVDRNPQKFMDIYKATEADYQKATQRVYRSKAMPSQLQVLVMP
ncbi:MAG: CocE/NonD family hydrolase [Blastocatellia bacterium]|nr:CocE/NonD family hydrolase [Blastocatellia bacterium]